MSLTRPAVLACRSLLMTSALCPERYTRAAECGADIGTVDLEDSVPADAKEQARGLALAYLAAPPPPGGTARALRLNSLRTDEGLRDLLAVLTSGTRPDILFLAKVESAAEPEQVAQVLGERLPGTVLLATIESARGLAAVERIAAAPRVWGLIFGAYDFSGDVGAAMDWETLDYARARIVAAATAAGLAAIDAPCFDLEDTPRLLQEIERGRDLAFDGKAAIHPDQLGPINDGFTPAPAALAEAREIVARAEEQGGRVYLLGGRMISPPTVQKACRLLAIGERLARRDGPPSDG